MRHQKSVKWSRIFLFTWNPITYDCVHKNPPLVNILNHMDPIHILSIYLSTIEFNLNLVYTSMSSKRTHSLNILRPKDRIAFML